MHRETKNGQVALFALVKAYGIYAMLALLIGAMSILSPSFFTWSSALNIVRQCSVYAILAFGTTFVFIGGGIDLSIGAITCLSTCVVAMLMVNLGMNMWAAVAITILVGAAIGAVNAFIIAKLNVSFFLGTLGTMYMLKGTALVITKEQPILNLPEGFKIFGGNVDFPVPPQAIIALIVFVVFYILLNHTKIGRYTFAIGSNEKTAKLSGVDVDGVKFINYIISGACAALAGVVLTARMKLGSPVVGSGFEMDAIAAVCIGGTVPGEGSLGKTVAGAFTLTIIRVGLNMLGITSSVQQIIIGGVIIAVVAADMYKQKSV